MLFDASFALPLDVEFTVVGIDAGSGRGVLVGDAGRVLLTTDYGFSFTTGRSAVRELRGSIDGIPVSMSGSIWVKAGKVGLLLSEVCSGPTSLLPNTSRFVRSTSTVASLLGTTLRTVLVGA